MRFSSHPVIWHGDTVRSVGFLHVAPSHVAVARALLAEHAPWIADVHLVDASLFDDLLDDAQGRLTRLAARIGELVGRDVDAVVCTCPELLDDVATAARRMGVPALDEADVRALSGGLSFALAS